MAAKIAPHPIEFGLRIKSGLEKFASFPAFPHLGHRSPFESIHVQLMIFLPPSRADGSIFNQKIMNSERILIVILGTGQGALRDAASQRMSYKTADYFLHDQPLKSFETPFVGEAIVRLDEEKTFDKVHILG
ncbi:MAG: hypothetical protein AAF570_26465, partial [Bacteroidota bacterium]